MALPMSLGTRSVDSSFYSGPSTYRPLISKDAPFSNNVVEFPVTSAWEKPSAKTWQDLMAYTLTPHAVNDNKLMYVTSNVSYTVDRADVEILGHVTHYEDRWQNFIPWKRGGEGPNVVSYSTLPDKSKGFIVLPEQRASYHPTMTKVNLFVKPLVEIIPNSNRINDVGRLISEAANSNEKLRNWLYVKDGINYDTVSGEYTPFTDDALDWIRFLGSNGIDSQRPFLGIGTADYTDEGAGAVTYNKSMIVLARDLQKDAYRHAARLGFSGKETEKFVKEYVNWVIKHEIYHTREPIELPERITEARIGRLQKKYHGDKANLYGDTLDGKMHRILERLSAAYERHWSSRIRGLSRKSQSKLENLANEAVKEAQEMGLKGDEAEAYIESRLSENFENYEGDEASELENTVDGEITGGEKSTDSEYANDDEVDSYDGEMAANDNEPGEAEATSDGTSESEAA